MGIGATFGNLLSAAFLGAAAFACLAMWLRPRSRQPFSPRLAMALALSLAWFAIDDALELHERFGQWLWTEHGIGAPPPFDHADDLIVALYLAAGAAVFAAMLPSILRNPPFMAGLVAAGALLSAGTAFDSFGNAGTWTEIPEEAFELSGAGVLGGVMLRAYRGVPLLRGVRSARQMETIVGEGAV